MCGIAGIASPDPADHDRIKIMTQMLSHRGPDSSGLFHDRTASLGHRRLSIIDLSKAGSQPMANEDNSIHLVCNGEIYNYKELTSRLTSLGHIFCSGSDSEVLLHLYEEYGVSFLDHVNGMFAFVIWDQPRQRMVAAVDRFGKKPLYYAQKHDRLALASEMKSLLCLPWVSQEPDLLAIDRYMTLRYAPAPLTMIKGVRKLPPAKIMVWENGKANIHTYWTPEYKGLRSYNSGAVDDFQDLFTDATRLRMQSDVPLGVYLSGGVDSAAVAGTMNELGSGKQISYSLSVDYEHNEYKRARQIADHLDFEFNPVTVVPDDFSLMPEIMYHLDEPFGDLLCIPAWLLAKKAKEKLTVVLTGDGADEILFGYFHQNTMDKWIRLKSLFAFPGMNRLLSGGLGLTPAALLDRWFNYPDRLGAREKQKLAQALENCGRFCTFYEGITSCFTPQDKKSLYTQGMASAVSHAPWCEEVQADMDKSNDYPLYSRLSLLDLKYWLPYSLLYRLDKLNMAHAVETRSPFLDYRLVEMALSFENKAKLNHGRNKEILRSLIERLYPPHLREKGKQAFYMPVASSYRPYFFKWVSGLLTQKTVEHRGLFKWPYIKNLLDSFKDVSMLVNRQLTAIAMLELWFQVFADTDANIELR